LRFGDLDDALRGTGGGTHGRLCDDKGRVHVQLRASLRPPFATPRASVAEVECSRSRKCHNLETLGT
jgi:hypothetical protein